MRPVTPMPMWLVFSAQRPVRVSLSLRKSFCAKASTKVITLVATGRRTPSGAIDSITPLALQAGTSIAS